MPNLACFPSPVNSVPNSNGFSLELQPHERRILKLVSLGCNDREIGAAVRMTPKSISNLLDRLRARFGCANRCALVAVAIRQQLIEGEVSR